MTEITLLGTRCIAMNCGTCGVVFAMSAIAYETARREGGFFSCPNGHSRGWKESESQRTHDDNARNAIRLERDRLAQQIAQRDDYINDLNKRLDVERRERKRITVRANNGVCQDCHRSFANLVRHRATKHGIKCEVVKLVKAS